MPGSVKALAGTSHTAASSAAIPRLNARQELTTTSTAQTNRLRALLRDGDDTDRRLARARLSDAVLAGLVRRRQPAAASRQHVVRHAEIRRLALALREAVRALKANRTELTAIVNDLVPGLTTRPGIGPVSAAQAIVSFSHAGRCRNDAAFAKLAGTSPIGASSGQTTRHRLNRSEDRALNKAIHVIANTRMRSDPSTQAYMPAAVHKANPIARSGAALGVVKGFGPIGRQANSSERRNRTGRC
ncbi:MAG: transposase [Actinomycetota bacterium]|nr:transposase [Actinomycetota bacterium]